MKPIHNHHALLSLALAVVLMVAALYAYMYHAVSATVSRALVTRTDFANEEAVAKRGKDLLALYDATADIRAKLSGFFVPADKAVTFIEALESLGPESGAKVSLSSIAADSLSDKKSGSPGVIRVHMDARGSWASVMRALILVEDLPYAVSVNHVRLDGSASMPVSSSASGSASAPASTSSAHEWVLALDIQAGLIASPPLSHTP